jgi:hypothetical protein
VDVRVLNGRREATDGQVSALAVCDSAPCQVVGRNLDGDDIAGHDSDEVLSHLTGDVSEDFVLDAFRFGHDEKLGVGQGFDDFGFEFNGILGHVCFLMRTIGEKSTGEPLSSSWKLTSVDSRVL